MCSFSACAHKKGCKVIYDSIVVKGKRIKLALIAVCNKLLKQAFSIAKSEFIYNKTYRSKTVKINEILPVFLPQYFVIFYFRLLIY